MFKWENLWGSFTGHSRGKFMRTKHTVSAKEEKEKRKRNANYITATKSLLLVARKINKKKKKDCINCPLKRRFSLFALIPRDQKQKSSNRYRNKMAWNLNIVKRKKERNNFEFMIDTMKERFRKEFVEAIKGKAFSVLFIIIKYLNHFQRNQM